VPEFVLQQQKKNSVIREICAKKNETYFRETQLDSNVPHYRGKAGEDWEKGEKKKMPLVQLIGKVASHLDLKKGSIISTSRKREVTNARGIICHLAINHLGYGTSEVGRALSINRENAGRCAVRGKEALDKYGDLTDIVN